MKLKKLSLTIFLLQASLLVVGMAQATKPLLASGDWTDVDAVVNWMRMANGNTIISQTGTTELEGDFTGSMVTDLVVVVHPNGRTNMRAQGVFTGTVNGASGTAHMGFEAVGDFVSGAMQGMWVIHMGTDGLANLRGRGTMEGVAGVGGTYSGQIHFDP